MIDKYEDQVSCVDPSRKIEVYRNLHKDCWSVRQKGIVRFHCYKVHLRDCEFVVQPAGRAKVLREKKKNVHAFVRGHLCDVCDSNPHWEDDLYTCIWDEVEYNPYKADTFTTWENIPVTGAMFVDMAINEQYSDVVYALQAS
tara:strand:+ start:91 stop:516 length:426 start_codon:yes stop_codon:yes gene_type:complete